MNTEEEVAPVENIEKKYIMNTENKTFAKNKKKHYLVSKFIIDTICMSIIQVIHYK